MKLNDHFTGTLQTLLVNQQHEHHNDSKKTQSTLYDLLATKSGIDEFYKIIYQFYSQIYTLKDQYQSGEYLQNAPSRLPKQQTTLNSNSRLQNQQHSNTSSISQTAFDLNTNSQELNEYLFLAIMNEIFQHFVDFQASEIFMMFQVNDKVTYKDIYLIVCMFVAQSSNQSLEFFYQFGELIFQSLIQYNKKVLGLTLKVFSKIFGVESRRVTKIFKQLNMKPQEDYNYEDFEIYCFTLCNNDKAQGQGQTHSKFTKQLFVSKNHDMNSPVLHQVQVFVNQTMKEKIDSSFTQQEQSQPYWSYTTSSQAYLQSRSYKKN